MSATVFLAATLLADSTVLLPRETLDHMNSRFARAHEVRVEWLEHDVPNPSAYVTRPHATEAGLDYEKTPGRTPLRFRFEGVTVQEPPRPIPWESIRAIEWRHGDVGVGILVGSLTTAVILAGVVAMVNHSGSDVGPNAGAVILGAAAGGVLAGVIASGVAAKTEVIYRRP